MLPALFVTDSVNVNVCASPPGTTSGAVNVAIGAVVLVSVTVAPPVCAHRYVNARGGAFGSTTLPGLSVTVGSGAPVTRATVWAVPAIALGRSRGELTVTLTGADVVLSAPLSTVNVKVSVCARAPAAKVGAVNVVLSAVGVPSVTVGPRVCFQR